ncbi:glycosyltransferase [Agrobacterium vitis]|uniref:glycosyltransferase n=1 Tax=Agrobacterium vitis TaxID=373 RepID=UPI001F359829|nr:glycosyltransferase [Agrobacterium vitis]MCF1470228.1 glycosyltransferase [Agrobacterium vitis]
MNMNIQKIEPDNEYLIRFLSDWTYRKAAFSISDKVVSENILDADVILELAHGDKILAELVTYLAASKRVVETITKPFTVGIVFAVWREARRLQPRIEVNPAGEDALRAKVAELNWLFQESPVNWTLYVVDDECPEGSLDVAQAIVEAEGFQSVELLRLRDALPSPDNPLKKLKSADLSVKGGAILLGLERAAADNHDYVMFTDCDNSNNLGQIGLFLQPLLSGHVKAAIGDRRSTCVSHWQNSRDSESDANYILKRVRQLLNFDLILRDVTCPFKMFNRDYLIEMLKELDVFDFCIDYDMLGQLKSKETPLAVVPIVSLDSDVETTWIALSNASVWWQKLKGFVYVVEKYGLAHNREAASLVKNYLGSLESIKTVLDAGEQGVVLDGRQFSPAAQLELSLGQIEAWLQSILSK